MKETKLTKVFIEDLKVPPTIKDKIHFYKYLYDKYNGEYLNLRTEIIKNEDNNYTIKLVGDVLKDEN